MLNLKKKKSWSILMDWEEGRLVFKFVFRLVFWARFGYEFWNGLCLGKYFSSNNLANETQQSKVAGDWAITSC